MHVHCMYLKAFTVNFRRSEVRIRKNSITEMIVFIDNLGKILNARCNPNIRWL